MLEYLRIENMAVIERTEICFGEGLNVLTGETGAGKSIIIDAIGAIMGERVSRELVRSGTEAAVITAQLSPSQQLLQWMKEHELEMEPGESAVLQRRILADGRSSCRLNGTPVSAAQLRELSELLFDLFGQNDGKRLLSEATHRSALDVFGQLEEETGVYEARYREWRDAGKRLETLRSSEEDREYKETKLRREIRELTEAGFREGEADELERRALRLRSAEKLTDRLSEALRLLMGGEQNDGAADQLAEAAASVESAARTEGSYAAIAADLTDLRFRTEDAVERIRDALRELEYSPGDLDRIETRLSLLRRLEKRYGSAEAATRRLESAKLELEDLSDLTERLSQAERRLTDAQNAVLAAGAALAEKRHRSAAVLCRAVEKELRGLSMPDARFRVEFQPKGGNGFDAAGTEDIRFLLSANAGQEPGRLSRIASGGELSRIMLALKNVLRSATDPEILIFDEVDTGVSGIAAQRVAEKLAELSCGRQVLCVTHLPQLAAMADMQFLIRKTSEDGKTRTAAVPLDREGRRQELARLIGGETVTESTLKGAGELIGAADRFKQDLH